MDFFLFCLLNAVLFLRPAEIVPSLVDLPIYQCVILANLAISFPYILKRLQIDDLREHPINLCVLGVLIAVPLSHLRHFDIWDARYSFMEFGKTALYYALFVSVIRNESRLHRFFAVLLVLLAIMTSLSLLHHHGVIHIPQLDSVEQRDVDPLTGDFITYDRLQSTGIFNDPNDFAMILVVGIMLSLYYLETANLLGKPFWLLAMGALGYALVLTKSRGGFLALFLGLGIFAHAKWGWKRAAILACLMVPLLAAGFAMRNDGGLEEGTGQRRVQLWIEGFSAWKQSLTFGIGYGTYGEEAGQVAHNSFVHTYVELGLFGGTMFFGCFYLALRSLLDQRRQPEVVEDPIARRRTTLTLAILAGAAAAMCSLSRAYEVPIYMIIGIGAVATDLNGAWVPFTLPRADLANGRKLAVASFVFVVATYVFARTMVHWG